MTKQRTATRLKRCILPVICLVATVFGYGPWELFLSNRGSEEFWFSAGEMAFPLAVLALAAAAVLLVILLLLPTKGFHAGVALITAVSVLMLLQGMFLPNGYGSLNGAAIDWSQYTDRLIYNTVIWVALIVAALVWALRDWKRFYPVARYAACFLLVAEAAVLVATGVTGKPEVKETTAENIYLTTENEFTVSGGKNTIVFILDAFDSQLMCDLLEENPEELRTSFENFTFYHNTSGGATRTKYGIPYILTGRTNDTGGTYSEYLLQSFETSPLFRELRSGKYSTGFFTEYGYVDRTQTAAIDNLSSGGALQATSQWGLTGSLLKMAAFKYMPHVLKPAFWMYSFDLIQWRGGNAEHSAYRLDDVQFYQQLKSAGLSADGNEPAFRFIHLKGAHGPFTMNENMESVSSEQSSEKQQGLGSLRIVSEYIEQLKDLGVYRDASIFIMADHGDNGYIQPNYEQNPLLMIKKAGNDNAFAQSDISLSYHDVPTMLTEAVKGTPFSAEDYETHGTRYFYVGTENNNAYHIIEYATDGKAYDAGSYYATGHDYEYLDADVTYELGKTLYFGEEGGSTAKRHFVNGFSYPESSYVWTSEKEVKLQFGIAAPEKNLLLSFDYVSVSKNHQRVYVYAGDTLVASYLAEKGEARQFVIPKECVQDGTLNLRLYMPDAASPLEEGTGVDGRILGLALGTIQIDLTDREYEPDNQITLQPEP